MASGRRRGGAHRRRALCALCPEKYFAALVVGRPAHVERRDIEQRRQRAELESLERDVRTLAAQEIDEERGEQRPVDDKAGVAFDSGDVAPIVVDAMAIERQRRITEQQYVVGNDPAPPRGDSGWGGPRG